MRPIDLVIGAIQARGLEAEDKGGGEWLCQCPAHNDRSPSLKVTEGRDGTVLMKCWSQKCPTDRIVMALGLEMKDLFPPKPKKEKPKSDSKKVATYIYCDLNQVKKHATVRMEPKSFPQYRILPNNDQVWSYEAGWYEPKGKSWIRQKHIKNGKDDPPSASAMWFDAFTETYLFRVHLVVAAAEKGEVIWLCEGEKDSLNVGKQKDLDTKKYVNSTCQPMGAGHWKPDYTNWLKGAKVKQILDRDEAGYKHGLLVAEALAEAGIEHELYLPAAGKDASDHLDAGLSLDELVLTSVGQVEELLLSVQQQKAEAEGAPVALKVVEGGAGGDGEPPKGPGKAKGGKQKGPGFADTTDLGNAMRFIAEHGEDVRYCEQFGNWLTWETSYWKIDETGGAPLLTRWMKTLEGMKAELVEMEDPELRKAWGSWVKKSHSRNAIDSLLDLVRRMPEVAIHQDELDRKIDFLPVANGVVNLRTGELVKGQKTDYFTKCVKVAYKPDADCPNWVKHLDRATEGDAELKSWLHKAFGYTLTGSTAEQCMFFLYGEGKTGKSTTLETIQDILGPYSASLDKGKLMVKRFEDEIPTHFARLVGRRMTTAVEVNKEDRFDEGLLKKLTGGDEINTRFMRKDAFDYKPMFKLFLTGNHKPTIYGQDQGIWRRIKLVPFDKVIAPEEVDPHLDDKLKAEHEGILAWMIAGAMRWFAERLGRCEAVDGATDQYRAEQDTLGQFIADRCLLDEDYEVGGKELFKAYQAWAKDGGYYAMNLTRFGSEMEERRQKFGYHKVRRALGVFWKGVGLRTLVEDEA